LESVTGKATALLARIRETPMQRGKVPTDRRDLKDRICGAVAMQGISPALAERIARQAAIKLDESELIDHAVWTAVGELLRKDFDRLRAHLGLADRQIVRVLPKLSARQVESFFRELVTKDRRIARTILNAAFDAAEPISTGRRFLDEYHHIAEQLDAIDPRMARTLANATFTARTPHNKAVELLKRFSDLMAQFGDDADASRMLVKATFAAASPREAAQQLVSNYAAIVTQLVSHGVEVPTARTLAGLRRTRRTPRQEAEAALAGQELPAQITRNDPSPLTKRRAKSHPGRRRQKQG
jgi:hypothetical protein